MAGFDTIIEGDEVDPPISMRGNASLYNESPMAKLLNEYMTEASGNSLSTEATVVLLVTLDELEPEHIVTVENRNKGTTKYKLADSLLEDLSRTAVELQVFVEKASSFLEERSRYFTVDPKDTLLQILRGTTSLPQLNVAWKTIQRRLELGHKTLQKYVQQYQSESHDEVPLSPISTLPELHQELQELHTADQRLRLIYQKFPHHHDQLSSQAEAALTQGKSWMNVLPLPQALKSTFMPEKESAHRKRETKGKEKEQQEEIVEDDIGSSNRVWLGTDTPYKGPNKWFGGGRLPRRESLASQVASRDRNMDQNVLFGIATPQLPSWATETPSSNPKPTQSKQSQQMRQWPQRDAPPHLSRTSDVIRRRSFVRNQPDDDPPDDDGDDDGDGDEEHNSRSNHHRQGRRPSGQGTSTTASSSRRGRRGGGGDDSPSEPSDGEGSSLEMDLGDSDTNSNQRGGRKIPYGKIKPTIKTEIKQEQLPRWDGNPNTAVKYFLKIQQLAALEGDLPEALGYWLWMNLEDGSDIKDWFATLTFEEQSHMRSHYINYLRGIKDGYLGEAWQFKINRVYEGQYFRQVGHEKELPKTFIIRRIMYTRMLTSAKPGGKLEMSLIMRKAPLSWKTILVMESIKTTKALYTKVVDYEDDLLDAWRRRSITSTAITADNIIPTLKRLGWEQPKSQTNRFNHERLPQDRRVMLTIAEEDGEEGSAENYKDEPQEEARDDIL